MFHVFLFFLFINTWSSWILRLRGLLMNAVSFIGHILSSATTHHHDKLPQPTNVKVLSTVILNHLRFGRLTKAVSVLFSSPVAFDFSLYAQLFQICASDKAIVEARKVESHLISFTPKPPIFLLNRAIEAYGKCGCLADARELFDEMPHRDGGSWNAMITAYSRNGCPEKALALFHSMNSAGVFSSEVTFASVLGSCSSVLALWLSRQVHGLVIKYGFSGNVILESSLVDVYGKCMVMRESRRMFDEIENPNEVSWNVIIRRYLQINEGKEAVLMFFKMVRSNLTPLTFTVSSALVACSAIGGIKEGRQIHGYAMKINFAVDEFVVSSLISMYTKCGDMQSASMIFESPCSKNIINWTSMVFGYARSGKIRDARMLFDEMKERNIISWNAMLAGYSHSSLWEDAMNFIASMCKETKELDNVSLGLILNVCSGLSDIEFGKQVHGYAYRQGLLYDLFVGNALLDMYGKCGSIKKSRDWFLEMSNLRDEVSWNALLTSHTKHGLSEQAMEYFWDMVGETTPSSYTFATLLAACANIFAVEPGKQIHGFMIRNSYPMDTVVVGALVDMYSKCRCMEYGLRVFRGANSSDVILWNCVILGCVHNRRSVEVIKLFELMEQEGIRPDHVTFQGLLLSCISEGLVELGRQYFDSMSSKYCIIPRLEHYQSMVELYGRSGFLHQLEEFMKKMPFEPTATMSARVLELYQEHGRLTR